MKYMSYYSSNLFIGVQVLSFEVMVEFMDYILLRVENSVTEDDLLNVLEASNT
jgi:hypothetical protein